MKKISLLKILTLLLTLVLFIQLINACKGEEMAQAGDTVKVHYTGTLEDGSIFDSSSGKDPLEFTLGEGNVIAGFDAAVTGMKVGETKTVTIPSSEAYGMRDANRIIEIPRSNIPQEIQLELGMQLQMQDTEGQVFIVTVVDIRRETIVVDANHPLVGKDLTFEITLVEIK
jgi:peptidylprolyl isomerase